MEAVPEEPVAAAEAIPTPAPAPSDTYLLRCQAARIAKVGVSADVTKRLAEINSSGPHVYEIVDVVPGGGRKLETMALDNLLCFRSAGEFLKYSDDAYDTFLCLWDDAKIAWAESKKADEEFDKAVEQHGLPPSHLSTPISQIREPDVFDAFDDFQAASMRKRKAEAALDVSRKKLQTVLVRKGVSSVDIQGPEGDVGSFSWKERTSKVFDSKLFKAEFEEEADRFYTERTSRFFLAKKK